MKRLQVYLQTAEEKRDLGLRCGQATAMKDRMQGLLGRDHLEESDGLLIESCRQVHMFFMRFPIDALFLDHNNVIVAIESLRPWRISWIHFRATKVLELAENTASRLGLEKGQRLEFLPC